MMEILGEWLYSLQERTRATKTCSNMANKQIELKGTGIIQLALLHFGCLSVVLLLLRDWRTYRRCIYYRSTHNGTYQRGLDHTGN